MIRLDAATVLLQWAVGGLAFTWFTTRRREVGLGYGWLMRSTFMLMAGGAFAAGLSLGVVPVREAASLAVIAAAGFALVVSILRRGAGVSGQREEHDRRSERVAAMTGIERYVEDSGEGPDPSRPVGPEFPPVLDLVAPIVGSVGLVAAAVDAGGNLGVSMFRTFASAAFLGSITAAMLLGHWYLVQPGLPRRLLNELVSAVLWILPFQVVALLLPTGMLSVISGTVDDGWGGILAWFWVACAVTTLVLCLVTRAALKERSYSAVMAATGLLYLAILTAFGTDLVARAVLAA